MDWFKSIYYKGRKLDWKPFFIRYYDNDGGGGGGDITKLSSAELQKQNEKLFQEVFNSGFARGTEKTTKEKQKELLEINEKLQAALKGNKLSEDEMTNLQKRIKELQDDTLSTDEKFAKQVDDLRTELTAKIQNETKRGDNYQALFENSLIEREILDYSATAGAHSPRQVVALLAQQAEVQEVKSSSGKLTGKFQVIIPTEVEVEEDGTKKKITKDLSTKDAVTHFFEQDENANLLQANLVTTPNLQTGKGSLADIEKMGVAEIQAQLPAILERMGKGELVSKA